MSDSDDVYRHTQTEGTIAPVAYKKLVEGLETDDEHFAIAEFQSSSSLEKNETFTYMAGISDDVAKRLEEQAKIQTTQQAFLSQQESINDLTSSITPNT